MSLQTYSVVVGAGFNQAVEQAESRYESAPLWTRRWDAGNTDRLNQAHWLYAQDQSLNAWLSEQLPTIRGRASYEVKNNGMLKGMIATHADDIVGPDGPQLQVQSDDDRYNEALEELWRQWFYAPTHIPNMSGSALLRLWVKSLWKQGGFLAQIITDSMAEGPVKLRLRPMHTRRLGTPAQLVGNDLVYNGVEYDLLGRPVRYWIQQQRGIGTGYVNVTSYDPVPADLVIHEYIRDEEDQGIGDPWLSPSLQPSADLRDYDDAVQDAARQLADNTPVLKAVGSDVVTWTNPESMTRERRVVPMLPPGWEAQWPNATQPAAQYPEYRGERMREFGRPVGMPLMLIRLDSSKHNYSSARFDSQVYDRAVLGIQSWLSGSEQSYGTLNRLVDEIAKEARFSVPELRSKPNRVVYEWTWPKRPHVDPSKEANGDQTALQTGTLTEIDVLASRGETLERHIAKKRRVLAAYEAAGMDPPDYGKLAQSETPTADDKDQKEKVNA
ncbi:MAG: phage portal protein [Pirellulaceae bacterium]